MQTEAIIVFNKNPQLGKAKTRIAKTVGDKKALDIYNKLLEIIRTTLSEAKQDILVYYSSFIDSNDDWDNSLCQKYIQEGDDLGQKMFNALQESLQVYDRVILIGTDCPYIRVEDINFAFLQLEKKDIVIGPALDGGYYLIGMKKVYPCLFEKIKWSSNTVLSKTKEIAHLNEKSIFEIVTYSDIDYYEDWKQYLKQIE